MKKRISALALLALLLCTHFQAFAADEKVADEAKPVTVDLGEKPPCLKADQLTNALPPPVLYASVGSCIREKNYDDGALIYGMALTYGFYDTYRVADATKHSEAMNQLVKELMAFTEEERLEFKNATLIRIGKGPGMIAACKKMIEIGRPVYVPTYMIGKDANPDAPGVMVPDFDWKEAWLKALSIGLRCPTNGLQLPD